VSAQSGGLDPRLVWLLVGNVAIGSGVLAPAGMMTSLMAGFSMTAPEIGRLIVFGAVVLCIGAPVLAFLTNRVERRLLLCGCLALYVLGHAASAHATSFDGLMAARLAMISAAAVFTPQAASAVSLFIPAEARAPAVTFVFLGWSLAAAFGMPAMTLIADLAGWRWAYGLLAVLSLVALIGVWTTLPRGLFADRLSLGAWGRVFTSPAILTVLAVTAIQLLGQFALYPYLAAEVARRTGAEAGAIALILSLYGVAGLTGAAIATRWVGRVGIANGVLCCLVAILSGLGLWALLGGSEIGAAFAVFVWGLGFAAGTSLQQARLIAISPALSSASVALNTSVLYAGQAGGSAIGGAVIAAQGQAWLPLFAAVLIVIAMAVSLTAQRVLKA
jgi:predicted MFS family arabinose efflux permease